jgi:putative ABC transport system ATP-binding protein
MSSTAVDIAALRYSWTPGVPVLDIPSLTVATGERLFLQGPSGSGKSTLLGILGGVLVPESGTVHVLGTDLAALRPAARDRFRADHVGFIFQMFNLVPYLTVIDNVTLAGAFSGRRLQRAGRDADDEAKRLLAALGLGNARQLRRPAGQLSVGQQQRVAAARALFGRPELLIADEPTSALDTTTLESFLALLMEECAAAGTTLVFVSHDSALGHLFDRRLSLPDLNLACVEPEAA